MFFYYQVNNPDLTYSTNLSKSRCDSSLELILKLAKGLTELFPLRSKKEVGPFSFSIDKTVVNNSEQYCCLLPTFSLRRMAKILRISFPDMLCPPMTWINWAIFKMTLSVSSWENQSRRKFSIPALTQDARLEMESLSSCWNTLSPWCRNNSLLCPIRKWQAWHKIILSYKIKKTKGKLQFHIFVYIYIYFFYNSIVTTSEGEGIWTLVLLIKETNQTHWATKLLAHICKSKIMEMGMNQKRTIEVKQTTNLP